MSSESTPDLDPIAIVGLAAQLPGKATTVQSLWDLILAGESTVSEVPPDRFYIDAFYHPKSDRLSATSTRYGNFLKRDLGAFDAGFFNTPPLEATTMDPAQRILLETAYHALENAGLPMESVAGSDMACYVGASGKDYESLLLKDPDHHAKYTMTGIGTAMLANRVSWYFDLRGPSFTLDTGCSSSIIALHQACAALRAGEADGALVGGSNLSIVPDAGMIPLSNMGFLSPDGRCWSFDSRANGFGRADGQGFIVLKRLSDAVREGLVVRAIVRSTAINQDGRTPGLTMPSAEAQVSNVMAAYKAAGLDLGSTTYFEAHGTGTQVGDMIEATAIHRAFNTSSEKPLYIGSVKANIGHLEAAAGLGGVFKSIFMLETGLIPGDACSGTGKPNPQIPFQEWGLRDALNYCSKRGIVAHHLTTADNLNTFCHANFHSNGNLNGHTNGYTNSRSIHHANGVDGLIDANLSSEKSVTRIFMLSAADENGIDRLTTRLEDHFRCQGPMTKKKAGRYLASLAYTLSDRRSKLPWKSFFLSNSISDLQENLATRVSKPTRSPLASHLTFVFSGQGANYAKMGIDLIPVYKVYRESIEKSDRLMRDLGSDWSLLDELHRENENTRVFIPKFSQPLSTALQIALFDLVESWGLCANAVIGHSSGEISAAYAIGALSHKSAIQVAYFRGVVADKMEKSGNVDGSMASVGLSEEEIAPYIADLETKYGRQCVQVACVNSNVNVTLSGQRTALVALGDQLAKKNIFCRPLAITVPYHSIHMNLVADEYLRHMGSLEPKQPRQPFSKEMEKGNRIMMFSSVTKDNMSLEALRDPQYWVDNLLGRVNFYPAMKKLISSAAQAEGGYGQMLEVAPHAVLQRSIRDILVSLNQDKNFEYESLLFRNNPAQTNCLNTIGRLACRNIPVNINSVNNPLLDNSVVAPLTTLPNYPFNHSQSYWHESRISVNHRFRKYPRHELLGCRAVDWNPLEPRWRNIMAVSDIPWLQEPALDDSVILNPAALLTLPIEALRQLYNYDTSFSEYELRNVSFGSPLIFTVNRKEIEVQTALKQMAPVDNSLRCMYTFTLYAWETDEPRVLCSGTLSGKHLNQYHRPDTGTLRQEWLDKYATECTESVEPKVFYKNMGAMGYLAGPAFQKASSNFKFNVQEGKAIVGIDLSRNGVHVTGTGEDDYFMHPTSLETIFQISKAAIAMGGLKKIPRLYPTTLKSIIISGKFKRSTQPALCLTSKINRKCFRDLETSIIGIDVEDLEEIIVVNGLSEGSDYNLDSYQAEPDLYISSILWKPDISRLSTEQIVEYLDASTKEFGHAASTKIDVDLQELISLDAVREALHAVDQEKAKSLPDFLQRYYAWMQAVWNYEKYTSLLAAHPRFANPETRPAYVEEFIARNPTGELLSETSKAIVPILQGKMNGLDFLFNSGLADRFYSSSVHDLAYNRISSFVDLKAHKNPELKILEIGAGTGGATRPVLQALSSLGANKGVLRFSEYCFTDISPAFFEKAQESFSYKLPRMVFKVLDIEKDPGSQGFEENKYDIIIASLVLHATTSLRRTLRHVRSLLNDGGQLILYETTGTETSRVGLTFGLVPGWWLGAEPERRLTPCVSTEGWHKALVDADFLGIDFDLPDHDTNDHKSQSVLVATAKLADPRSDTAPRDVILVVDDKESEQIILAEQIRHIGNKVEFLHFSVKTMRQLTTDSSQNATYVFLLESRNSFLKDMSESDFDLMKLLLTQKGVRVIWVTNGCGLRAANPEFGMFTGLGRTLTTERLDCRYTELSFEESDARALGPVIFSTLYRSFDAHVLHEPEISYRKGLFHVPRVMTSTTLNQHLKDQIICPEPELATLKSNNGRALALSIQEPGNLDSIYFKDMPNAKAPLASDEILIKIKALGLSMPDYLIATGEKAGAGFGNEFSGIITDAGPKTGFATGDCVYGYCLSGAVGTYIRTEASTVARMSPSLSFIEAAGLPYACYTAYYAIIKMSRLQASDRILIHSGTSPAGLACAQMAVGLDATVYMTVDDQEQLDMVTNLVNIPRDRVYTHKDRILAEFDIILNLANSAEHFSSWLNITDGGRFIEASDVEGRVKQSIEQACDGSVTYTRLAIRSILENAMRAQSGGMLSAATQLVTEPAETICLPSPEVFSIADLKAAIERVRTCRNGAKVVVNMDEGATVAVVPAPRVPHKFKEQATYVVAGGFGGLGRALIPWMAERGARNFIVLSRSGCSSEAARSLVTDMADKGVRIESPKCDLTSVDSVRAAVNSVRDTMPAIKGCLQAAMVLSDVVFENMTHSHWMEATRPKVQGTWSLHSVLPRGMDFFIMLSSIAGIMGSPGQSNYAAGNTFQDALARHRRAQGEHGIALDLGAISGVGAAAERNLDDELERRGMGSMPKPDLLACLEYCLSPSLDGYPEVTQMVTGLGYFASLSQEAKEDIAWSHKPLFSALRQTTRKGGAEDEETYKRLISPSILLKEAQEDSHATNVVLGSLKAKLSRVLSVSVDDIDASLPVYASGVDSLTALEIKNWFSKEIGVDVPVSELMRDQSLFALASHAARNSEFRTFKQG
ncbi:Type I Iterative PKS [Metarhizium acridum]|nr:Type I Iterative PKS [Metarhizium acridum]